MTSADVYRWLMSGSSSAGADQFDAHVVACVLSLAVEEAQQGTPLCASLGLSPTELRELATGTFSHASSLFSGLDPTYELRVADDEGILRDLLLRCASERTRFQQLLAYVVARRAQSPNHLWQDLGLRSRKELSWLMARHFGVLASRNSAEMKWKKFLYRTICRDQSYTLCTAPSCSECEDFDNCFGDESGESRLAVVKRATERADVVR